MSTNPDDEFAGYGIPQWSEENVDEVDDAEPEDAEVPEDGSEN